MDTHVALDIAPDAAPQERLTLRAVLPLVMLLGSTLLAATAGSRVMSLSAAETLAFVVPAKALQYRDSQPTALAAESERWWALGDYPRASQLAANALRSNPLNGAGYRVLALVADAGGDRERAGALMRLALKRTPSDLTARRWLADRALDAGQFPAAVALQDRTMRLDPGSESVTFVDWYPLLSNDVNRQALVRLLAASPPWRTAFLKQFAAAGSTADVDAVFSGLLTAQAGALLEVDEKEAWLRRLTADGRWLEAYRRWQSLQGEFARGGSLPVNGNFESAPGPAPFDWMLGTTADVEVDRAVADGGTGQALRLQFLGRRAAFDGVRQTLVVNEGAYRLRWRYRLDSLDTPRGLQWVAACANTGATLAESGLMAGDSPWRDSELTLRVPADCGAVQLKLQLAARIAAESAAYGTAWFDTVRLDRLVEPGRQGKEKVLAGTNSPESGQGEEGYGHHEEI